MREKKYEFMGVDAKTELVLSLITGVIFMMILLLIVHFYDVIYHSEVTPTGVMEASTSFSLTVSLVVLRLMCLKKRGFWKITSTSKIIEVEYKYKSWILKKATISEINYVRGKRFIYLTLKSDEQMIKMRVGVSALTPFSKEGDLEVVDLFISDLNPFLVSDFTQCVNNNNNNKVIGKYRYKRK